MSEKRTLAENVFSLSTLQAATYIAPLIILPYLVRVVGPAYYGEIIFSQAFIQFFLFITDYGFSYNGAREVAVIRDDPEKLRDYFSEALAVKLILLVLSLGVVLLMIAYVPPFNHYPLMHLFTFGIIASETLTLQFFFQGLERMRFIAIVGIAARVLSIAGIFLIITKPEDFIYTTLIYSLSYGAGGVVSFVAALKLLRWKPGSVSIASIVNRFRENFWVFITATSITLSNAGNIVILRVFASPAAVGIYGAAEKIIMAAIGIANPVLQTMLPYISRLAKQSRETALKRVRQSAVVAGVLGLLVFLGGYFLGEWVIQTLLGKSFGASLPVFWLLCVLPLGYWVTVVIGNFYFIGFGMYKLWSKLFTGISAFGVALALVFVGVLDLGATGLATALIIRMYIGVMIVLFFFAQTSQQNGRNLSDSNTHEAVDV